MARIGTDNTREKQYIVKEPVQQRLAQGMQPYSAQVQDWVEKLKETGGVNGKTSGYTGGKTQGYDANAAIVRYTDNGGEGGSSGGGSGGTSMSPEAAQANALFQQLMSRGDFQYDMNADPLFQQAKEQYMQAGQLAMRDTMGTAAGLTGGYGNSYADTVGNQAWQQYLTQLYGMAPDYYDRALEAWQLQGDDLYNRYQLALSQVPTTYSTGTAATESTDGAGMITRALNNFMAGTNGTQQLGGTLMQEEDANFQNYYKKWLESQKTAQ